MQRKILLMLACLAAWLGVAGAAYSQQAASYTLLSNASASGDKIQVGGTGNYFVSIAGTFGGATLTLTETMNASQISVTLGTFTTATVGNGLCVAVVANATVQMTVTGGSPSGLYATLGGVGPGGCNLTAGYVPFSTFGGRADGVCHGANAACTGSDNSAALNAYKTWVCTLPVASSGHISTRPVLQFGYGTYLFTSAVDPDPCSGMQYNGQKNGTNIENETDGYMWRFNVFTTAPTVGGTTPTNGPTKSYYVGLANFWYVGNLVCSDQRKIGAEKARTSSCLADNGAGSGMAENISCWGMLHCINAPYGAQIDAFNHISVDYSDSGISIGPGGNQVTILEPHMGDAGAVYIGMQFEYVDQVNIFSPDFATCGRFGTTNHDGACANFHFDLTTTSQGVPICITTPAQTSPCGNATMQMDVHFHPGWWETGNGGAGLVTYAVNFEGTQNADAIRGVTIDHPDIIGGNGGGSNLATSAFIGGTVSGLAPRSIYVNEGTITGTYLGSWFSGVRVVYHDLGINNLGTTYPLQQSGDANALIDATVYAPAIGVCPATGYYVQGTRTNNSGAVISGGKIQIGCIRITPGTITQSNTLGTDWSVVFGTTTGNDWMFERRFAANDPLRDADPLGLAA